MLKKIRLDKTLLIIVLAGLGLRLVGTTHGFPFIFHPDEPALIRTALGMRFDINPGHFDWPHMHIYLNYFLYFLFIKFRGLLQAIGLGGPLSEAFPLLWRDPLVFYFLSRVFDAFIGALTAIPVYLAAKELFNKKVGYLAAAVLMVLPHHLYTSSFALIDIPTAFWVAWAFYFSTKIYKGTDLKNYLLAGLFVGFAASTKYNGGLMALMVPVSHLMRTLGSKAEKILDSKGFKALFLSGVLAALGFFAGTPFSVFDYETFSRTDGPAGAYWQFTNVGKVDFPEQITQFIGSISYDAFYNYGYTIIVLYLAAVFYGIFIKRERKLWMVLLPSLFLFFYISGFSKTRAHYYTSVYPLVAVVVGYISWILLEKVPQKMKIIVLGLIFVFPVYFSFVHVNLLLRMDTRVEMYNWLVENTDTTDYLYYNSSGMVEVMKKFSKNEVNKGLSEGIFTGSGYVLLGLNDSELVDFKSGVHPEASSVADLEKVYEISAENRRGTNIIIYEYGKN